MRKFSDYVTETAREFLQSLADRVPPGEYREAMTGLGRELGRVVADRLPRTASILLICTNEDADFLARGVLEKLQAEQFGNIALACFWNERKKVTSNLAPTLDTAAIVRRYVEPTEAVDAFVVVKSVISSACVVRTNITEMVYDLDPRRILVVAPVMYTGGRAGLEAEFEPEIARRFEYVWFAEDDVRKQDGEVVPGIGGSVYELLDIGTQETKNQYSPDLVRQRREALASGS
jgi:hypothetical protein